MLTLRDLYTSYADEVFRFAYWLAGNEADADDITSETFVRAWTRISVIRTETVKAYLLKIARNVYLQQLRRRNRHTGLTDQQPDAHPGPHEHAEHQAELETVCRVLQTLPEIDRAALVLRVQHGLPYAEIARVLQVSETAAKVKLHRARKKMILARDNGD